MVFPIKKRFVSSGSDNEGTAPSGLDLLSAVIDVRPHPIHPSITTSAPEGMVVPSALRTEERSSSDDEDSSTVQSSSSVPQAEVNSHKRAKPFPEILMDILSNPEYDSIISWLPHGKSFAIHNSSKFATEILPKYFRRVIFRSFIRKLNRWGFRSVKRSVSGFESTFEHKLFCRDEPKLCAKMYCKSNPVKNPPKSVKNSPHKVVTKTRITPGNTKAIISPNNSILSVQNAVAQSQNAQTTLTMNEVSRNEEFPVHIRRELILRELRQREMQQNRQQALMQLVSQMSDVSRMSDGDIMSRYIAQKLQLELLQQRGF